MQFKKMNIQRLYDNKKIYDKILKKQLLFCIVQFVFDDAFLRVLKYLFESFCATMEKVNKNVL